MVLRLAAGRFYAHYNGEDVIWLLGTEKEGSTDVPERPVEIAGPDAAVFLDYLVVERSKIWK